MDCVMNRKWTNQNVCYDNPLQKTKAFGFYVKIREQVSNKKCGLLKKTPIRIHPYRSRSAMMSVSCLLSDVVNFEPLSSITSIFFDDKSFQVRNSQFFNSVK